MSLTPDADYELERHGVARTFCPRYIDLPDSMRHHREWSDRFATLMDRADAFLAQEDPRFPAAGFRPFATCRYLLELSFLNIVDALYVLRRICEQELPDRIEMACNAPWPGEADMTFGLLHGTAFQRLLPLAGGAWGVEVGLEADDPAPVPPRSRRVGLPERLRRKGGALRSRWRAGLSRQAGLWLSRLKPGGRVCLSVDSLEVEHLSLPLLRYGWQVRKADVAGFEAQLSPAAPYALTGRLLERVAGQQKALCCLGVDFSSLFLERVAAFASGLERMLDYLLRSREYLARLRPDVVVFHSHAPLPRLANSIWPVALRGLGIPYACWVHGLYGLNYSHSGFSSTDLLLGQHYFVYGRTMQRFLTEQRPDTDMTYHVAGTPRLERYRKHVQYRREHGKKTVAIILNSLIMQPGLVHLDSPDILGRYWEPVKAVLDTVSKHSDRYDILLRPYDNFGNERVLLEKYIEDHGMRHVSFSDKLTESIQNVYEKAALSILFWVSSSTLEACCTKGDVFLYDRSDLTPEAKRLLPRRLFWESDLDRFCSVLDSYLEEGRLGRKADDASFLNEVMDLDRAGRRAESTAALLRSIVEGRAHGRRR